MMGGLKSCGEMGLYAGIEFFVNIHVDHPLQVPTDEGVRPHVYH